MNVWIFWEEYEYGDMEFGERGSEIIGCYSSYELAKQDLIEYSKDYFDNDEEIRTSEIYDEEFRMSQDYYDGHSDLIVKCIVMNRRYDRGVIR